MEKVNHFVSCIKINGIPILPPLEILEENAMFRMRSVMRHKEEFSLNSIMEILKQMNTKLDKFDESLVSNGEMLKELQNMMKVIKMENKELKTDNLSLEARIAELEKGVTPDRRKEILEIKERAVLLEQSYRNKQLEDNHTEGNNLEHANRDTATVPSESIDSPGNISKEAEMQCLPNTSLVDDIKNSSNVTSQNISYIDDCDLELKLDGRKPKESVTEVFEKEVEHQVEDISKPRLIRSNSYTLDTPSSILLDHLKRQSVSACEKSVSSAENLVGFSHPEWSIQTPDTIEVVSTNEQDLTDLSSNIYNFKTNMSSSEDNSFNAPSFEVITTDITVQQINFTTRDTSKEREFEKGPHAVTDIQSLEDEKETSSNIDPETELQLILQQIPENYAERIRALIEEQKEEQKKRVRNYESIKSELLQSGDFENDTSNKISSPKIIFVSSSSNTKPNKAMSAPLNSEIGRVGSEGSHYCTMEKSTASSVNNSETLPFDISTSSSESLDNFSLKTFRILELENEANNDLLKRHDLMNPFVSQKMMNEDNSKRSHEFDDFEHNEFHRLRQEKAASIICAYAKGYLVRRLMNTGKVKTIIRTIQDALVCALELQGAETIEEADVELHRKLIKLVSSACFEFHDIFFTLTIPEQMDIIALDREKMKKIVAVRSTRSSTEFRPLNEITNIRASKSLAQI